MRLVVAITGASGAIYGIRTLLELKKKGIETHLVISKWAEATIRKETDYTLDAVKELACFCHDVGNLGASISSGSFRTDGMVVAPCSMKTLAGIANGYTEDLIVRAADVTLKEHRRLVLVTRESPLNPIHLENMLKLARIGVTILPPVPAFYIRPQSLDDIITHTMGRILDHFGLESESLKRWGNE